MGAVDPLKKRQGESRRAKKKAYKELMRKQKEQKEGTPADEGVSPTVTEVAPLPGGISEAPDGSSLNPGVSPAPACEGNACRVVLSGVWHKKQG